MAKKTVLITGASGNIGKATITALARYSDAINVKAGVRDPARSSDLASLGPNVSVVAADPLNKEQMAKALEGVDYVYAIAPGTKERDVIDIATIDAAKAAGVEFLLVMSTLTADQSAQIFGKQFYAIEQHTKASGLPHCFIRLGNFLENFLGFAGSVKAQGTWYDPVDPTKPSTPVAVRDAGEVAAKILSDPKPHTGKTYPLGSPPDTNGNLAKYLSDALGKPVTVTHVPYDGAKQAMLGMGMDPFMVSGVIELATLVNTESPLLNVPDGAKNVEALIGRPATTVEQWAKDNAGAFA